MSSSQSGDFCSLGGHFSLVPKLGILYLISQESNPGFANDCQENPSHSIPKGGKFIALSQHRPSQTCVEAYVVHTWKHVWEVAGGDNCGVTDGDVRGVADSSPSHTGPTSPKPSMTPAH